MLFWLLVLPPKIHLNTSIISETLIGSRLGHDDSCRLCRVSPSGSSILFLQAMHDLPTIIACPGFLLEGFGVIFPVKFIPGTRVIVT